VTQPHRLIVGELDLEVPADLLWAPPLIQELGDNAAQLLVDVDTASMVTGSPSSCVPMSVEGSVSAAGRRVAPQFAGNRRRRPAQSGGDRSHAQSATTQIGDLDALILG
jgi:hypothetical protein